jgi:hypothetical protein
MRITSAGNLGLGIATPVPYNAGARIIQSHNADGSLSELKLTNTTTGTTAAAGLVLLQAGLDAYLWNGSNSFMSFGTNNEERMRITSAGTLILNQGQIQFPATQVPSANANTLDDYEEGTWTPSLVSSGGGHTVTYSFNNGTYIKIGRLVILRFDTTVNTVSGGSGNTQLAGLPFTSSTNNNPGALCVAFNQSWSTNAPQGGNVTASSTSIDLRYYIGSNLSNAVQWSNVQTNTRLIGVVTYEAAN